MKRNREFTYENANAYDDMHNPVDVFNMHLDDAYIIFGVKCLVVVVQEDSNLILVIIILMFLLC